MASFSANHGENLTETNQCDSVPVATPDANGWLPIESAPRDGAAIILYASHGVSVGWWEESEPTYKWRFIDDFDLTPTGCCNDESDDRVPCNGMHADTPTHWQPLPSPPIPTDAGCV